MSSIGRMARCVALLPLAAGSCELGSRSDCDDHGVCVQGRGSFKDPFFNTCRLALRAYRTHFTPVLDE